MSDSSNYQKSWQVICMLAVGLDKYRMRSLKSQNENVILSTNQEVGQYHPCHLSWICIIQIHCVVEQKVEESVYSNHHSQLPMNYF